MKNIVITPFLLLLFTLLSTLPRGYGQGCVAIRQFSGCGIDLLSSGLIDLPQSGWQIGTNYRYFKSFRHFRGDHEEAHRLEEGTEVINWSHGWDLNVSYGISNRLFANFSLPFVYNKRSSLYEHGRTERHSTYSSGLGDARIGLGYWIFNPEKRAGSNLSVGLGMKIPTGDYGATSTFFNVGPNGEAEVRPVDQSIQPGDGGWGIVLDVQLFQQLGQHFSLYGNGFYLSNPRETNGTLTNRRRENEAIMSVPDQFGLRAGFTYFTPLTGLAASLGSRMEGIPVRDLIGGSSGFRRPGYVVSVEPGFSYTVKRFSFVLNVPVALYRNRTQSVTDIETEQSTGEPRHGDAAFADYLISAGVTYRFGGRAMLHEMPPMKAWEEAGPNE